MPSDHAEFRACRHFAALDGLRAASILAVVWHHSGPYFEAVPMTVRGFLGVDMFFVLSGFLIVTLLLRERDRIGDIDLGAFYARRALRIFPPYYAILALLAVVYGLLRRDTPAGIGYFVHLPFYLTYTSNWIADTSVLAIAWSLATEEQFYLVWPPLEKWLGGTRRFLTAAMLALLAFLALNQAVNFGLLDDFFRERLGITRTHFEILQITFTPICLGVILAHLLHRPASYRVLQTVVQSPFAAVAMVAAILAVANVPGDLGGWPRLTLQLLFAGLLAHFVIDPSQPLARCMAVGVLRRIGAISYGIYLYHVFARHAAAAVLRRLGGPGSSLDPEIGIGGNLPLFALTLILSIVVAELSFRFFESPILAMKRRYAR